MKKENLDIISKNIKTAFSVPVIFLFLTLFNYNASGQTGTTLKTEIDRTIEEEQIKIDEILKENKKDENKIKIKMSQLLEQGKQVVKPWEHSWQFGINYFHYSSHGKSAPHYERIFVRDKSIFNRSVHPEGEAFKHLVTRYDEHSASNNMHKDFSYGSVNIKHDNEPMGTEKLFPTLNQKPMETEKLFPTLNQKPMGDIFVPEIKEGVYVEPITVKPLNFVFDTPEYGFERPNFNFPQRIGFGRGMMNIQTQAYISTDGVTPDYLPDNVPKPSGDFPIIFAQQSYSPTNKENKGKFNITFHGDGTDNKIHIKSDNVSFTSVYFDDNDNKHKEALTTSNNFDTDIIYRQRRYPLAFSGGSAFEIKNTDMLFDNKNPVFTVPGDDTKEYAINVVSSITPYDFGDTTLVIDKDSSITLTGMSSLFTFIMSPDYLWLPNPPDSSTETDEGRYGYYNLAMVNNGKFNLDGTQETGVVTHATKDNPIILQNSDSGKININGEENSFIIVTKSNNYPYFEQDNKTYIPKFSIVNDGEFKVSGKNNTGIILEHGVGEVILNKPITIDGENNIGIKFEPDGQINIFAAGTDVKQDAHNSSDPEINSTSIVMAGDSNGKLRNSFLNINISGKNNYGIFNLPEAYDANVDNFNIKSENGEGNNLIWLNNPMNRYSSVGTKVTGNDISKNLVIKGGRKNTGITFFENEDIKNRTVLVGKEVKIDIQNSPESVGIKFFNELNPNIPGPTAITFADINIDSPASTALFLSQSKILNTGKINFKSSSFNDGTKDIGAIGIAVISNNSNIKSELISNGDVNIDISGKNSVGLLSKNEGTILISNSHISARDKGVAVYANGGIVQFEDNNTIDVHENGVGFLSNEGLIGFTGANPTIMNIHGNAATGERGIGAVIPQTAGFNQSFINFNENLFAETLDNLKVNLDGGIAFYVDGAKVEYSHTLPDYVKNTLNGPDITGNGAVFSLNGGKLTVDKDMNLDSPAVLLNNTQVEVKNGINVTGTKDNEHFIVFENKSQAPSSVANTNAGNINLTGDKSVAIYVKNADAKNSGDIKLTGKESVAMEIVNDNVSALGDLTVSNNGNITLGEKGTGIYYTGTSADGSNKITGDIKNSNTIESSGKESVGILINLKDNLTLNTLKNSGDINLTGDNSIGIAAKENRGNFSIENSGNITVGDSDKTQSSVGILNNNQSAVVTNSGHIKAGKNGICIYGYEIKSLDGSEVTIGDHGVGFYSPDKNLNIKGDLHIGKDAVGIYTGGNNREIKAELGTVTSGDKSVIILNKGNGNKIVSSTPTVNLGNNSVFILSKDATSKVESSTNLNSAGNYNVGIYGKDITNSGDMDFSAGTGNIAIHSVYGGEAVNTGHIKVGKSDRENNMFSIGMAGGYYYENKEDETVTNVINEAGGTIDVVGDHGIGMYASGRNSKAINKGTINITGKDGIGIYGYEIKSLAGSEVTVGDGGVGFYSPDKNLDIKGDLHIGKDAVGIYTGGNNREIKADFGTVISGDKSVIIFNKGNDNKIVSSTPNVNLGNNSVFILSKDANSKVENSTNLNSTGNYNVGIYGKDIINSGDMDFSAGTGNIAIHSVYGGEAVNTGYIKVGKSDRENNMFSIGMAGGYFDANNNRNIYEGTVINRAGGVIEVGEKAIGLYATGRNSKAINEGTINITGKDGIGIYVDNGAVGENHGTITATADATGAIGALALNGAVFKNYGDITITAPQGTGVTVIRGGEFEKGSSSSTITAETVVIDETSESSGKKLPSVAINQTHGGGFEITVGDVKIPVAEIDTDVPEPQPQYVDVVIPQIENNRLDLNEHGFNKHESNAEVTKFGMYIDTSGVNYTNPIKGLSNLPNLKDIELIFGVEGARYTNEKGIKIGKNILEPYNEKIEESTTLENVTSYSGSLTWIGKPEFNSDGKTIKEVNLVKRPYTDFSMGDENLRRFTDGLEKRYGVEDIYSREKELFNKLNDIGKNENILLNQAFKEMMGYQYTNTDRRIADSRRTFDREFDTLMKWDTETKDTTKVKIFREDSKFRTDSGNGTSYNRTANGVFILNNNETVTLGDSQGWFFGVSQDDFKFRDIGRSKEKSINGQIGYYKAQAFGNNRETNYLIKGGIDGSYRKMYRRYLVVDDIFEGRSRYHSMGIFLDGEVSKEFRITEGFKLKPSVGVDLSLEKFTNINEKRGEMRLVSKGRTELTATPKAEVVLSHSTDRSDNWRIRTDLGYKIYKPYARNTKMKARVNYTDADWYSLERDRYHSSSEVSFGIALEKPEYGIGAKVLRNLNQHYTGYQVDFRIKF